MSTRVRICFVCLGNICRSPTALGVMRQVLARAGLAGMVQVDSAGTSGFHVGEAPDPRSSSAAMARGYPLEHTAWRFRARDFARFDLVLAMDRANHDALLALTDDAAAHAKVHLLRSFDPSAPGDAEVPDPYHGGARGFDEVLDICEAACAGLLAHIRKEHGL